MFKKLKIVAHVYNYHRIGCYFLSSFVLYPPKKCQVEVVICYCEEDWKTSDILDYFGTQDIPNVEWTWHPMERTRLMRRAIGRNEVTKSPRIEDDDFVLFVDADYLFYDNALDQLAERMTEACIDGPKIMYPYYVQSTSQEHGDEEIERCDPPQIIEIDRIKYTTQRIRVAIGGVQYVPAAIAKHGYLPHSKRYQKTHDTWQQTHEDKSYRYWIKQEFGCSSANFHDIETIYRIRHSKRGRFDKECRL